MESRKIIVVSSADQSQHVLMSGAETLGELKAELADAGIDYEGMTFLEGHTKTEMSLDEAILPTNIPYRGGVTNELVFLMTTPQKKIRSGASRITMYSIIKSHNLEDAIKREFGKNFTNVSTDDLASFLDSAISESKECKTSLDEVMKSFKNVCKSVLDMYESLERFTGKAEPAEKPLSHDDLQSLFGDMANLHQSSSDGGEYDYDDCDD
jgi:hypothetical protein